METAQRRSSMVAMNVASLPSNRISVITLVACCVVFTVKPLGAFWLSGETASAIAWAVSSSSYSRVRFASKFLAFQLLADQFVG